MTKIKAKYIGDWDPEYTYGEIYLISPVTEFGHGKLIAAENKYGEAYIRPKELFVPIEDRKTVERVELFDHVKIKASGKTGVIVDIVNDCFTVESDEERRPDDNSGYPGRWPLYICEASELEKI